MPVVNRFHYLILNPIARGFVTQSNYFDRQEKFYWDFFTNGFRVDGIDTNADENAILRIPSSV